jgi:eukaryotic-like serine/threonine-protein kinase
MGSEGLLGTILDGRYRIEEVAGEGGHGTVYRALHLAFDLPVAVKVLKVTNQEDHLARRARIGDFRREGRILFELSALHPSLVQAKEAGTVLGADGLPEPYLVLEWLSGVSLATEMKRRRNSGPAPMTLDEVIRLLDWPAEGLAMAHARGVAHRDLKPGNLFLTERDGAVLTKVLDFGLAKAVDSSLGTTARSLETTGRHPFTPSYGAPEQWLARLGATGPWTDVHAWAQIVVELLSGRAAFQGSDSAQLMGACLDVQRPTPGQLGVSVSAEVEGVFARALSLHPSERFRDIREFWRALREAAAFPGGELRSSVLLSPLGSTVSTAALPETCADSTAPTVSRSRSSARAGASGSRLPRSPSRPWRRAAVACAGLAMGSFLAQRSCSSGGDASAASPVVSTRTAANPSKASARVISAPEAEAPVGTTTAVATTGRAAPMKDAASPRRRTKRGDLPNARAIPTAEPEPPIAPPAEEPPATADPSDPPPSNAPKTELEEMLKHHGLSSRY